MLIAIPANDSILSQHFGRCQNYYFFEVDQEKGEILNEKSVIPPAHQPGVLPAWISQMGADLVMTGGMGPRAVDLFRAQGVDVLLGVPSLEVRKIVESYLDGSLRTGSSACDHGAHDHHGQCH